MTGEFSGGTADDRWQEPALGCTRETDVYTCRV